METIPQERFAAASVLGVEIDADEETVKTAWRAAVKAAHPDMGGSAEDFAKLTAAFETMSEPLPLDAAVPRVEVAAGPQVQPRPELPPLFQRDHVRVGIIVMSTPLLAALVIVVYVLAPGVAVALIGVHVAGLWVRVAWIATGKPPLWRWLRHQTGGRQ